MVRQLLLTTPGERVNLPQFGCGLRALVFAPDTDALAATVQLRVIQGLGQWLAGVVNVVDVVGGRGRGPPSGPGTLQVTVTYTLMETQATQTGRWRSDEHRTARPRPAPAAARARRASTASTTSRSAADQTQLASTS